MDSGGFFALLDRSDEAHDDVVRVFEKANAEKWHLVTTNTAVVETYALLVNRTHQGRTSGIAFSDHLERTRMRIERATEADERNAIGLVRAQTDKSYSLCDAQSFVVMERLKINDAIAADDDFRQYGWRTLL